MELFRVRFEREWPQRKSLSLECQENGTRISSQDVKETILSLRSCSSPNPLFSHLACKKLCMQSASSSSKLRKYKRRVFYLSQEFYLKKPHASVSLTYLFFSIEFVHLISDPLKGEFFFFCLIFY